MQIKELCRSISNFHLDDFKIPSSRKRLQDFQRTGMYEFGKSAMEYVVDSMNSVGNVRSQ